MCKYTIRHCMLPAKSSPFRQSEAPEVSPSPGPPGLWRQYAWIGRYVGTYLNGGYRKGANDTDGTLFAADCDCGSSFRMSLASFRPSAKCIRRTGGRLQIFDKRTTFAARQEGGEGQAWKANNNNKKKASRWSPFPSYPQSHSCPWRSRRCT